MTTQDTHHENNDADAAVVEHASTPENEVTASSTPSETALPAGNDEEEGALASASAPHMDGEAEAHREGPASIEAGELSVSPEIPAVSTEAQEATGEETVAAEAAAQTQEVPSSVIEAAGAAQGVAEAPQPAAQETQTAREFTPATTDAPAIELPAAAHTTESEPQLQAEPGEPSEPSLEEQQQMLAELSAKLTEVLSTAEPVAEAAGNAGEDENIRPAEEHSADPSVTQTPPLIEAREEEVRPFTDFIAEFRQAEAALRDSQAEALSLLSSVAADLAFVEPQAEEATIVAEARQSDSSVITDKEDGVQVRTDEMSAASSSEQGVQAETTQTIEKEAPETTQSTQPAQPQPTARPVSPLLRPASRLRLPRHGVTRHQREEAHAENQAPAEAGAEAQPAKAETQQNAVTSEPAGEGASPRPARRYRFDRPATLHNGANGARPAAESPAFPVSTTGPAQPRTEEVHTAKAEANQPAVEQPAEPQVAKPAAQETDAPATGLDHGKRRHSASKEQPAAPAAQPVSEVETPEPVVHVEEVAPEDLPPLEYSDLQKASSRRRRRHRSSPGPVQPISPVNSVPSPASSQPVQSVPAVQPIQPVQPAAPVNPLPAVTPSVSPVPQVPAARSNGEASPTTYTIVSGYTVNQMNQGNDASGPFMGPDPSPARGSMLTRDGRTMRAETRTAQPSAPVYPSTRSGEAGISTAAMTQFANIVSQALQTQTDRMVSEFRRISQAPTNVSVTLPPFPSTERVGVFVDVANLLYSARTLRIGVDFGKLLDFLRGNRRLVRAHAYCPTSPQPGDEQMFLQAVKGLGYRITTKNYKTFSSGAKKADLDLDLCMDVVRLVDGRAVDCVVLVSGDSDFMPMLDYCSDHGVRVEVAAFDEAMSATLRQSCDLFINLSMLEEIRA